MNKMEKSAKIIRILLASVLCFLFVACIVDTNETRKDTNFDQDTMLTHIEKLSENGPRSIIDTEANEKAMQYIISQVESYGVINGDTTETPAYLIQDYVAADGNGKYQNFYLKNVIVHVDFRLGTFFDNNRSGWQRHVGSSAEKERAYIWRSISGIVL